MGTEATVVIPCMGASRRFTDEGYPAPKILLPVSNIMAQDQPKSILERILNHIPSNMDVRIICRSDELKLFPKTESRLQLFSVNQESLGQSHTLQMGMRDLDVNKPVFIQNSDNIFAKTNYRRAITQSGDRVFYFDHPYGPEIYSYMAEPQIPGQPYSRFAEKKRIGPKAMAGLWYFESPRTIIDAIDHQIGCKIQSGLPEYYLSTALNFVRGGMQAQHVMMWADLGTPDLVKRAGYKIHG